MSVKILLGSSVLMMAAVTAGCVDVPAAPEGSPQQVATGDGTAVPSSQVKYCQTDGEVGSHLRTKTVCLTEDQEREQRQALEAQRSFRQTGQGSAGGH